MTPDPAEEKPVSDEKRLQYADEGCCMVPMEVARNAVPIGPSPDPISRISQLESELERVNNAMAGLAASHANLRQELAAAESENARLRETWLEEPALRVVQLIRERDAAQAEITRLKGQRDRLVRASKKVIETTGFATE